MPKVSIHLITYNGEKYLPYSLDSLEKQIFKDFSILIIDNCSCDNTREILTKYLNNPKHAFLAQVTKVIYNKRNIGFAPAHNQAILWTKSDYVLMMNQDVILEAAYIERLVDCMQTHPTCAAATGLLYQWKFDEGKTNAIDSIGLKIFPNHKVVELQDAALLSAYKQTNPIEVFGVSGALPLYRRIFLEESKVPLFDTPFKSYALHTQENVNNRSILYEYFDNDFFVYKEDVDLSYRLRLFGYGAYLVPQAVAWHDRGASQKTTLLKNRKQKSNFVNYHSYKNHLYFLFKNVPLALWFRHAHKILIYEIGKIAYITLFERKTLAGLKEVVKNALKMNKKRKYIQKKAGPYAWKNIQPWLA